MLLDKNTAILLSFDNLNSATETMSKAFREDPLWQHVFPDEQKRQRALARFFEAILTASISRQQTYGIGTPPAGVAVWSFPGQRQASLSTAAFARLLRLAVSPFALAAIKVRSVFAQFERMQKVHAPSNVGLYEHFGFRRVQQYAAPGTELGIWAFYRAAPK